MEKKRSVFVVMECPICHAKWQSPAMWNEEHTELVNIIHPQCPSCGNEKTNVLGEAQATIEEVKE